MYAKAVSEKLSRKTSLESVSSAGGNDLVAKADKDKKARNAPLKESEILRKPQDIRDDPKYEGQTQVFLTRVPLHSVDERREVDERALREWVMYGIIEEDPFAQHFFDDIGRISKIIEEVERNLLNIPKLQFLDENGQPMRDDRARDQRAKLFDQYGQERVAAETRLEDAEKALKDHVAWRKKMTIEFEQCSQDHNTGTADWRFKLSGSDDVDLIEDLLLQKMNWSGIKLAAGEPMVQPPILPWAGRGNLPSGDSHGISYSHLQVNMLGVRVKRAPQGIGFYRSLDRRTTTLYGEEFSIYYGEHDIGVKNGYGIEVDDCGVYTGTYEKGFRKGHGRLDLADGTTIVGHFSVTPVSSLPQSLGFRNPYMDGEPNGQVEIFFGDGGYYRGQMTRGTIDGQGDYQSAFDEVLSGNFRRGSLHGERGFHRTITGETLMGRFCRGALHGPGSYQGPSGLSYEGYWDQGMRHGRGVTKLPDWMVYRGYYVYNLKHGKGSLEFKGRAPDVPPGQAPPLQPTETTPKKPTAAKEPVEENPDARPSDWRDPSRFSDLDYAFLGYLHGNAPANRGSVLNCATHTSHIISRASRFSMDPINAALKAEEKVHKKCRRMNEKFKFVENFMREEICRKKSKIYRQQKHMTKKMVYEDDVMGGLRERKLIDSKLQLRENRLNKFVQKVKGQGRGHEPDPGAAKKGSPVKNPNASKAVIPRLRLLNTTLNRTYTATMERLRPEPDELRHADGMNEEILRLALSDMEEVRERQRFLKYDMLWQRAEEAFVKAKQDQLQQT